MKTRVGIGFIHNNDEKRNNLSLPKILELANFLKDYYDVRFLPVSFQPDVNSNRSITWHLNREFVMWKCQMFLHKYLKIKLPTIKSFNFTLIRLINLLKGGFSKLTRVANFEIMLSDKHIRLWSILAEDNDYIIIFEDDAIIDEDSIHKIKEIIEFSKELEKENDDKILYVDLANGFELNKLKIDKLIIKRDGDKIFFDRIVSNTTCSYMISSKTAKVFLDLLLETPYLRLLPPDRIVDHLGRLLLKKGYSTICVHINPPALIHGSMTKAELYTREYV
ncbi:MAG: glycosyltransferase family 25 protein [Brevinematales bacterium]|nr:glycosyltransferase family 25 protein [Brevinematales bacterium]